MAGIITRSGIFSGIEMCFSLNKDNARLALEMSDVNHQTIIQCTMLSMMMVHIARFTAKAQVKNRVTGIIRVRLGLRASTGV